MSAAQRIEWRIVDRAEPIRTACQADGCNQSVAACQLWQTAQMPAPAFWYVCAEHALLAQTDTWWLQLASSGGNP